MQVDSRTEIAGRAAIIVESWSVWKKLREKACKIPWDEAPSLSSLPTGRQATRDRLEAYPTLADVA
jgi:hypothetical protein